MFVGRFRGSAAGATACENIAGTSGCNPRNLRQPRGSNGAGMKAKEKNKAAAPSAVHSKDTEQQKESERQKEIERLEKDVEELRHLAGNADADSEVERIRAQVGERMRACESD